MKISVGLCTARDDHCLAGLPDVHLFQPTVASLQKQTFRDFELVVVDGLHAQRNGVFRNAGFPVKHLPPKPSPYAARGMWALCNAINTALLRAEGELVVKIDDACQFDPDYLQRIWNWYTMGLFPLSLMLYHRGGVPARYDEETRGRYVSQMKDSPVENNETAIKEKMAILDKFYGGEETIRDSRLPFMKESFAVASWKWVYGYVSAPLKLFLELNGYDEAFDGKKSLEDVDMGLRAHNLGYGDRFVLEKGLWAVENFHSGTSEKVIWNKDRPAACNYAILEMHERQNTTRANTRKFTRKELAEIKKETARSPCSHSHGKDYNLGDAFNFWAANIPTFDLSRIRKEIGLAGS